MSQLFIVRASSWGKLFDCAHSWEGTHIMGLRMPSSPRALLGKGIHHGTAVFDMARINGLAGDADEAVGQAIAQIQEPGEDVDWSCDDLSAREMSAIAATLVNRYCREVSPHFTFRAVEMTTKPLVIACGGGINVELTGTLDRCRLRVETGGLGINDVKTGRAAVDGDGMAKTKGHRAQIGTYEILTEHTIGEPVTEPGGIIGMKTSGKLAIGFGDVIGGKELMLGTPDEPGLIQYAAEMFRSGMFPPNPQSVLCSKKYCARWATCKFHD